MREGYASEGRLVRFDGDDVSLGIALAALADAASETAKPRPPAVGPPRPAPTSRPHLDKDPYQ